MNITAITIGSLGDIRPFLTLGKTLSKRGHQLKIATFPRFQNTIENHGFLFSPIHGDEDLMMKLLIGDGVSGIAYMKGLDLLLNQNKNEILNDIYNACKFADMVLYTFLGSLAYHAAESLKIPCMRVNFWPADKTGDNPMPGMAALPLGKWYNRLTYSLSGISFSSFTKNQLNEWRNELGVGKWQGHSYRKMYGKPIETLYAYSRFLAPKPVEWGQHLHVTGFWFPDEEVNAPADEGLIRFLENGDKPIYIGFGSMVGGSFEEMQRIVLESLRNTGQRAILSSGWRKFDIAQLPPNVYCVDFVSHGWLFPRVKAVVHHGGAGTTAAGLRAGKPGLIIYFGGDQPFWGNRIHISGAGPKPIPRKNLTVRKMTHGLELLENVQIQKNAALIGEQFATEDGCKRTCEIIENYML